MSLESAIAANRFGLGARPGDLSRIESNPRAWLLDQLQGLRREQREEDGPAPDIVEKYGKTVREHFIAQASARYRNAAATDYPFHERLVHFWSNHFAVSADKQPVPAIAGLFENEAIRPNITGNFADLLLAVEQHPAMIIYLDNQRSVGPGSTLGHRANRGRNERSVGLNENLAREILELHTLGVDGGYSQSDVTSLAKVITGWSIGGASETGRFAEGDPGRFEFREIIHEPGPQTLLGKKYSQTGQQQGEAVLRDLAAHPSTARFLAGKLVRHFVADEPPAELVNTLATACEKSGGELSAM